jgi:hypothetical protein
MKIGLNYIVVYAMGFYGNRTITRCYSEGDIDTILTGCTKDFREDEGIVVNKKIVKLPQTECYVIYDDSAEITKHSRLVCSIPEQNIKIYDKCLFCRKEGEELKSFLPEDIKQLNKYIID